MTLCVPTPRLLIMQLAVLGLPTASVPAAQPIGLPFSVKVTLPLAALPLTDALSVMLPPSCAGFAELASVVVLATGLPGAPALHASISVSREKEASALVMVMRIALTLAAAKLTVRLTRVLPATGAPSAIQLPPASPST